MNSVSRRSILFSGAVMPAMLVPKEGHTVRKDTALLQLGYQFDALAAQLDYAIEQKLDIESVNLEKFSQVQADIIQTSATAMEGLCVKARVACWAMLGDLNQTDHSSAFEQMALSIIRDLIRLHRPDLERPGALNKLVTEIEENASRPADT